MRGASDWQNLIDGRITMNKGTIQRPTLLMAYRIFMTR
jgi:hypothetical protein